MKITVIESSPHKNGSSNMLAGEFIRGAKDAGHQVTVFDAAAADISPCLGCDACSMTSDCCLDDDMGKLKELILSSDMIVFVTPLYYFGMSAQLKTVIDRFYSFNGKLTSKGLKTALIAAAWDSNDWTMTDLENHYDTMCHYLSFDSRGKILGIGCGNVSMTSRSPFMKKAYDLGRSL